MAKRLAPPVAAISLPKPPAEGLVKFATEGGHWYTEAGEPMYEIMGRDGKMRPTTLRDARKLNLFPSVTTVMKVADAPALNIWKQTQLLLASLTLPRIDGEDTQAYAQRVITDADEQGKNARDLGSLIHGAIEKSLCGEPFDPVYHQHVYGAIRSLREWCGLEGIRPERSFAHQLGFGGKVDANKVGFVADYKSKDFDEGKLPIIYDNHPMQLAAYRAGFGMPFARCAIIFVSTRVPGLTHLIEIEQEELERGWMMFLALLSFWQLKQRYTPQITTIAATGREAA